MGHPFNRLHHVCIVVNDLESTVAYYESLGIGPWHDYQHGTYLELEPPNKEALLATRYKWCDLENVQVQLCQPPHLDSPQRHFLDEHGEGVYHLGFEVPDADAAERAGRDLGLSVTARARRADGSSWCYFDTRSGAGVTLEIRTPRDEL